MKPGETISKMVDTDTGYFIEPISECSCEGELLLTLASKIVAVTKERHAAPPEPASFVEEDLSFPEGADDKLLHWFDVMNSYKAKTMNPENDCCKSSTTTQNRTVHF